MTTYSFNLIDREWIWGVWLAENRRELISLRTALVQAHLLREIHGDTPPETAAIHRLLLTVLYGIFNPDNDWGDLWKLKRFGPQKIDIFFEKVYSYFNLFGHEFPFFQAGETSRAWSKYKLVSVSNLKPHFASGNDAVLFDHRNKDAGLALAKDEEEGGTTLAAAEAGRALVTQQAFGFGGLNDPGAPNKEGKSFSNAPCARGVVFLMEGKNLFETLMLNFFSLDLEKDYSLPHTFADKPAWEQDDPFGNDPKRPYGYLDYATWLNRKVLLLPEGDPKNPVVRRMRYYVGMKRMNGNPLNPLMSLHPNPKAGKQNDDGSESSSHLPMIFSKEKALWRDSGPLFAWIEKKNEGFLPPRSFNWVHNELRDMGYIERGKRFFFGAYGICSERGKDKMYSFRAERFPLPLEYLEDIGKEAAKHLQLALGRAERVGLSLTTYGAVGVFACNFLGIKEEDKFKKGNKDRIDNFVKSIGAERYFWSRLEAHFFRLVQDLPLTPEMALKAWDENLRQLARQGFEQAVQVAGGGRALNAYGIAADRFEWEIWRTFHPQSENSKEQVHE